jgi:hypothetical protein
VQQSQTVNLNPENYSIYGNPIPTETATTSNVDITNNDSPEERSLENRTDNLKESLQNDLSNHEIPYGILIDVEAARVEQLGRIVRSRKSYGVFSRLNNEDILECIQEKYGNEWGDYILFMNHERELMKTLDDYALTLATMTTDELMDYHKFYKKQIVDRLEVERERYIC